MDPAYHAVDPPRDMLSTGPSVRQHAGARGRLRLLVPSFQNAGDKHGAPLDTARLYARDQASPKDVTASAEPSHKERISTRRPPEIPPLSILQHHSFALPQNQSCILPFLRWLLLA